MSDVSSVALMAREPKEVTQTKDAVEIKQEPKKQGEQTPGDAGPGRINRKMRRVESAEQRKYERRRKKFDKLVEPKGPKPKKKERGYIPTVERREAVIPVNDDDDLIVDVHHEDEATKPPKKLLKSAAVKNRLGDISSQTLWRYGRDPELEFPKPFYIYGVRYWEAGEIDAFIERRQGLESCRRKSISDHGGAE